VLLLAGANLGDEDTGNAYTAMGYLNQPARRHLFEPFRRVVAVL